LYHGGMNNKNLLIVFIIFILVAIMAIGIFMKSRPQDNLSVVYLSTGEIYVGKLSSFPSLSLTDAYLLQVIKDSSDPAKNNFQLAPLSEALWSPRVIYLNRDHIIFSGPMNESSRVVQAIKNGSSMPKQ